MKYSKSELRRLFSQGAIEIDGEIIKNPNAKIETEMIVKIGKKRFYKAIMGFSDKIIDILSQIENEDTIPK